MKKHIRLFGALIASCAFINVAALSPLSAMAEGTIAYDTFVMEKGAAARVRSLVDENGKEIESNGLRFSAEISTAQYTALKEAGARFGVVIVAKDLLKGTEINETTVFGKTPSFYFTNEGQAASSKIAMLHIANAACANIDEDNNIEICGSIVNIKTSNFTRNFVGRAYVAIPQQNAETGETEYTRTYLSTFIGSYGRYAYDLDKYFVNMGRDWRLNGGALFCVKGGCNRIYQSTCQRIEPFGDNGQLCISRND